MKSNVIAFTSTGSIQIPEWNEGVLRIPVGAGFLGRKYAFPESKNVLHQANSLLLQSDLVVIHELYRYHIQWAGSILDKICKPYWVIPHGSLDPWVFSYRAFQKKIWLKYVGNRIFRHANAVIFTTKSEYQKAAPHIKECNTRIIPLPVACADLSHKDQAQAEIRSRHRIPRQDRILIWIGRLHPMKKPIETIAAFGEVGIPSLHLLIIGPDDVLTKEDCEAYCATHHIENVHVLGPIYGEEKFDYFMASDGYISLSHRENFNITAAEALASGLPVILSKGNDLSFELKNVDCGWMLADDSPEVIAGAIAEFASLTMSALHEKGQSGQDWVRNALSHESFARAIEKLVEESLCIAH